MQQKGKASLPLWHLFPLYKSCQVHFYLSLTHFLWDTQKHRPKVKKWKKIFNTCVWKHSLSNMIISKKYCFYDAVLSQKLCFLTFFESSSCALFRRPSKQPHFCKFGENFGSGAAILQGMVALPPKCSPHLHRWACLQAIEGHTVYIVPVASSLLTNPSLALCVCVELNYTAVGDPNVVITHPGRQPLIRSVIQSNFFKTGMFGTGPSCPLERCPGL